MFFVWVNYAKKSELLATFRYAAHVIDFVRSIAHMGNGCVVVTPNNKDIQLIAEATYTNGISFRVPERAIKYLQEIIE